MGLEALLAELDAEAEAERAAVLTEARSKADRIRIESGRAMSHRREERLGAAKAEEERKALAGLAAARSEARRLVLDARRRVADRVCAALEQRIESSASDSEYLARIPGELHAAAMLAPPGHGTVRVAPDLVTYVEQTLSKREGPTDGRGATARESRPRVAAARRGLRLDVAADPDVASGFLLVAERGRVVVDASLGTRLNLAWPRLATRVLRELDS